ncbi:MAG: hypothetical protein VX409_05640 [Verrucomicrobiota bacterium]|nr:hypothetical protein [Verrucomicrobiota bacterium]
MKYILITIVVVLLVGCFTQSGYQHDLDTSNPFSIDSQRYDENHDFLRD